MIRWSESLRQARVKAWRGASSRATFAGFGRWPLIRGTKAHPQRHRPRAVAAIVDPLVEDLQQCVEDGRTRFEDFVDEGKIGLGKLAGRHANEAIFLECRETDRPADFFGHRELGQEDRELAAAGPRKQRVEEEAFGGSRLPDEERVFVGDERGQEYVDFVVAFDEGGGQLVPGCREFLLKDVEIGPGGFHNASGCLRSWKGLVSLACRKRKNPCRDAGVLRCTRGNAGVTNYSNAFKRDI